MSNNFVTDKIKMSSRIAIPDDVEFPLGIAGPSLSVVNGSVYSGPNINVNGNGNIYSTGSITPNLYRRLYNPDSLELSISITKKTKKYRSIFEDWEISKSD